MIKLTYNYTNETVGESTGMYNECKLEKECSKFMNKSK